MKSGNTDFARRRLISQHIGGSEFKTAAELVSHMGAMQAQDFNMVKWAIGVRLQGSTGNEVEQALNRGEIIRTHLLRPTWHLVVPGDVDGLLVLTALRIKAAARSRERQLEIDEKLINKSYAVIERSLAGNKHMTREALMDELEKAGINARNARATHLMFNAELDGIVCSGEMSGMQQTYALLRERIPVKNKPDREESLARLARKYFTSHCPASLQDFSWWSGLTLGDAKRAMDILKGDFISEKIGEQSYWFPVSDTQPLKFSDSVHLLPAFDEFIISYRDRSASLVFEHHKKAVSDNGVFRPVVVINGQVRGVWKREMKKDVALIELSLFHPVSKKEMGGIEEAAERYGEFLGKKVIMGKDTA